MRACCCFHLSKSRSFFSLIFSRKFSACWCCFSNVLRRLCKHMLCCAKRHAKWKFWFTRPGIRCKSSLHMHSYISWVYMGYSPSVRSIWLDIGHVFFCMFMDREWVEVHKPTKKNEAYIQPYWPNKTWSIKELLYGFRGKFSCGTCR